MLLLMTGMRNANAAVTIMGTPGKVATAIQKLADSGFDARQLSIAAKDPRAPEQVVAYYLHGEHMVYWGKDRSLTSIWEILSGWALFYLPDIGVVLVAGPLAQWIITALNNVPIFGDMSAVGMGLHTVGIPREDIIKCELALKEGRQLLLVHGSTQEVSEAIALIGDWRGLTFP